MNGTVKELEFGLRTTYTLFRFFLAALKHPSSRPSRHVIFGAREAAHVFIASRQWTIDDGASNHARTDICIKVGNQHVVLLCRARRCLKVRVINYELGSDLVVRELS